MSVITSETLASTGSAPQRPYEPSWANRLTAWVERLPMPTWVFYLGLFLVLYVPGTLLKWSDGTFTFGTIFPLHIVVCAIPSYLIAMCLYLDKVAIHALQAARPALRVSEAEYSELQYRLVTLPARSTIIPILISIVWSTIALVFLANPAVFALTRMAAGPISAIYDGLVIYILNAAYATIIFHTIHQLRWVRRIYSSHISINLFQSGPLFAFSRLTSRTGIAITLPAIVLITILPAILTNAGVAVFVIATTLAAVVSFVWPLLDLHHLMEAEKQRMLEANALEMEASVEETHRLLKTGDFAGVTPLKEVVETLVAQQAVLSRLSTWPWSPATLRGFGTALLLPIILWIIQRMLDRLLGF